MQKTYEVVREIPNCCPNNQMRDVFFEEVTCEDPVDYVRQTLAGKLGSLRTEHLEDGGLRVYVESAGLFQTFTFTEI